MKPPVTDSIDDNPAGRSVRAGPVAESGAPRRVYIETLGCAKNRVDSELMLGALTRGGYAYTPHPSEAEIIVVNTCAFLTSASEESINRLLELSDFKSSGRCERLVCAGCLSERYRESLLEQIPELDGLLGSSDFHALPELLDDLYRGVESAQVRLLPRPHYAHYEHQERVQSTPAPYVYVKIAEGCSNMCSFCNIPSLRGYFSSREIAPIVAEVRAHISRGVREINLISQDSSSYGVDLEGGTNLEALLRAIDQVDGEFWVRLFYAYPNTFTEGAMAAIAESGHIVPYLDMPFQHINDSVLKAMNRRITESRIRRKLETLHRRIPGLSLRTTLITGFPTEGEAEFDQLLAFVDEGWFEHVGVFCYSHEDNITSARLGDPVPNAVKQERRAALLETQQRVAQRRNAARVGERLPVLIEGLAEETDLLLQGRAQFQGPEVDGVVYINEGEATAGAFHEVEITEAHAYDLIGRILPRG